MATISASHIKTSTEPSNTTTHTFVWPAAVPVNGKAYLLYVQDDNVSRTTPTGWTLEFSDNSSSNSTDLFSRDDLTLGTEEDDTETITSGTGQKSAHILWIVEGWASDMFVDFVSSNSSAANPPSITPTWGAVAGTLVMAYMGKDNGTVPDNGPTGYTTVSVGATGAGGVAAAMAYTTIEATSEDPDAFDLAANRAWQAGIGAVEPSASGGRKNPLGFPLTGPLGGPLG